MPDKASHTIVMRKIMLGLHSIVIVCSVAMFAYTFFAKDHLVGHARHVVTEKTRSHAEPIIDAMRNSLDDALAQKILSKSLRLEIQQELSLYDANPKAYIAQLTSAQQASFGTGKIATFKGKVYAYYQSTFHELIRDLRIFSCSNLVAGLFALVLLLLRPLRNDAKIITFTCITFAVVVFSSYNYLEGISFLRIILKSHPSWSYPLGMILMILWICSNKPSHKERATTSTR